ncbi:hypothetical protein PC118_g1 [Phytophthora cactorum]|uniref:Uncharacterized protein n=1 Tax=Phytophthora cactorum TaxID=29920 RepID=A0A8T1GT52_9STRA|nr:hypothetical protein PC118_g1 [Phytophthora cactorum]
MSGGGVAIQRGGRGAPLSGRKDSISALDEIIQFLEIPVDRNPQKIEPNTGAAINNDNDDSFLAPPILINWNFRELQDFVSRANATHSRAADFPKPARWLNVRAPYMTAASL